MKVKQLKSLIKHIMVEAQESSIGEMIANKDSEPDFFGAVNVEETESPDDVKRGEHYLKGKFVNRGEIKLQGGIDYNLAEKIANHHWDIFGSMGKDERGVYNFKTRGDRFCCAVGMLDGKPAMLNVTTTPGRLQLLVGDELEIIKENDQDEEYEFKNGDKVRFTPPYGGSKNSEVFTLSQWDGKRGRVSDPNSRGWNIRRGQIVPVNTDDIEEQSGSGAVGSFSTPMSFRKRKINESSFAQKVKAKFHGNVEEKTAPDGQYVDDMLDGGRMKRAEGLRENSSLLKLDHTKYLELKKVYENAVSKKLKRLKFEGQEFDTEYVKYMIEYLQRKFEKKDSVNEVDGTRYFAEVPVNSTFKIPGEQITLKKIGPEYAHVVSTDKKKVKIKVPNDRRVNIVKELGEQSATGGGESISVPNWGTKNKLGSPKAINVTKKMGFKVAKSITTENQNEYKPVNTAPEEKLLYVKWGNETQGEKPEYGIAKYVHGKWWNYSGTNRHAWGRQCTTPTGWAKEYEFPQHRK